MLQPRAQCVLQGRAGFQAGQPAGLFPPASPTSPTNPTHGWGCPVTCLMTWQYISSLRSSWHSCGDEKSEWVRQGRASRAQGAAGSDGCLGPE